MFNLQDHRQIRLSDLLKSDHHLITRKQYLAAVQRVMHVQFSDQPPPEMTKERERDLQLIEDYEREHPDQQAIHQIKVNVHQNESPPPKEL